MKYDWIELIAIGVFVFGIVFTIRTCEKMGLENELLEIEIQNQIEIME